MEDIIREEKLRRSRESGCEDMRVGEECEGVTELGSMKDQVRSKVEELSLSMEREREELELRMEGEMREFLRRQAEEAETEVRRHDLERSTLSARHR